MKRVIYLSMLSLLLLLAVSVSAEDVSLQAAVPNDAGTIELTVTLNETNPAVMENSSGIGLSAVPEPSTLVLVGLGVVGLGGWCMSHRLR